MIGFVPEKGRTGHRGFDDIIIENKGQKIKRLGGSSRAVRASELSRQADVDVRYEHGTTRTRGNGRSLGPGGQGTAVCSDN
jgi:hypothetical protein